MAIAGYVTVKLLSAPVPRLPTVVKCFCFMAWDSRLTRGAAWLVAVLAATSPSASGSCQVFSSGQRVAFFSVASLGGWALANLRCFRMLRNVAGLPRWIRSDTYCTASLTRSFPCQRAALSCTKRFCPLLCDLTLHAMHRVYVRALVRCSH
jgi:hypothetical protein